jgi:mannose-6-phosphate isomerase
VNAPASAVASTLLPTRSVEKPWGRDTLPPPFASRDGKRVGEIWFEPPPELPQLLVKYIFTSEKLSVQVHPSDAQTQAAGLGRQGKEECWLIVHADPGAVLGIGFDHSLDR